MDMNGVYAVDSERDARYEAAQRKLVRITTHALMADFLGGLDVSDAVLESSDQCSIAIWHEQHAGCGLTN